MSNKSIILFTALLLASFTCSADFQLTKDGKSQCNVVVKKDAPLPVIHGAKELALFTEKVSSAKIPVTNTAVKNAKNIFTSKKKSFIIKEQHCAVLRNIAPCFLSSSRFLLGLKFQAPKGTDRYV